MSRTTRTPSIHRPTTRDGKPWSKPPRWYKRMMERRRRAQRKRLAWEHSVVQPMEDKWGWT